MFDEKFRRDNKYNHRTVAVVLIGVMALFIIKTVLRPALKDLL